MAIATWYAHARQWKNTLNKLNVPAKASKMYQRLMGKDLFSPEPNGHYSRRKRIKVRINASLQVQPPTACSRPPPRTDQPVKRVSRSAKMAYMPTPITPTTISAAKTSGTLKLELAISITLPMPLLPAMISAMTVPTNDKVIAIFSEAKK